MKRARYLSLLIVSVIFLFTVSPGALDRAIINGTDPTIDHDAQSPPARAEGDTLICEDSSGEVSIYDIQQGGYEGQEVTTTGVVTADHTVFEHDIYEFVVIEDPQGGARSGIVLFSWTQEMLACEEGDYIRVQGTVEEYYDMTMIQYITSFDIIGSAEIPPAEILMAWDISNDNLLEAEKWESVLVAVCDAEVTDDDLGYGEFEIDDGSGPAVTDDWSGGSFKPYDYEPVLGDVIDVRGILWYSFDAFKIEPRGNEDIPTLEGYPLIDVEPDSFTISTYPDSLIEETLVIKNTGEGFLDYQLSEDSEWLSLSHLSGSVPPGAADTTAITFDSHDLDVGTYCASILVESNAENEPLLDIPVEMRVLGGN